MKPSGWRPTDRLLAEAIRDVRYVNTEADLAGLGGNTAGRRGRSICGRYPAGVMPIGDQSRAQGERKSDEGRRNKNHPFPARLTIIVISLSFSLVVQPPIFPGVVFALVDIEVTGLRAKDQPKSKKVGQANTHRGLENRGSR